MPRFGRIISSIAAMLVIGCASLSVPADGITNEVSVPSTPSNLIPEALLILLVGSALVGLGTFVRRRLRARN